MIREVRKAAATEEECAVHALTSGTVYARGGTTRTHGLPSGQFWLARNGLACLTGFTDEAHYKPKFNFHGRVEVEVAKVFNGATLPR